MKDELVLFSIGGIMASFFVSIIGQIATSSVIYLAGSFGMIVGTIIMVYGFFTSKPDHTGGESA